MIAGALLGFNRGARGHAAGLRTTILVTLAASAAMIQCNILLPLDGKGPGSFAVMDVMRLPLGILTGSGFLGGGAILKKGGSITGVTTAAVVDRDRHPGLCIGGGQLGLGAVQPRSAFSPLQDALDRQAHPARAQQASCGSNERLGRLSLASKPCCARLATEHA